MSAVTIGGIVFAIVFGGALLGMRIAAPGRTINTFSIVRPCARSDTVTPGQTSPRLSSS
jgi:hypothetical protein